MISFVHRSVFPASVSPVDVPSFSSRTDAQRQKVCRGRAGRVRALPNGGKINEENTGQTLFLFFDTSLIFKN